MTIRTTSDTALLGRSPQGYGREKAVGRPHLLCFLKSVCSRFTYANTRGKSAGFRRGVMSQPLSGPLPAGIRFLSPPLPAASSASLARVAFPFGETTGLPRSAAVTVWVRSRRSVGGASTAPGEFGAPGPDHVPVGPSDSAPCAWPRDGAYRRFTWVDRTTPSWFPTPAVLGVATGPRGCVAILSDEATLSRELRTPWRTSR